MFSGIVEELAKVLELDKRDGLLRLVLESKLNQSDTQLGDSICVSGVCLTVVANQSGQLAFDVSAETLRRSSLGELAVGDFVNLERSLALGDRLHGHFVFGHVDAVTELISSAPDGESYRLEFALPPELARFVAPKGSVTLAGVSLTIGEVSSNSFSVYIVPHTWNVTSLGKLEVGAKVNLEIDMLARYVERQLRGEMATTSSAITRDYLKEHGFLEEN